MASLLLLKERLNREFDWNKKTYDTCYQMFFRTT